VHFATKFIDVVIKQHLITKSLVRKLSGDFMLGILIFTGKVIGRFNISRIMLFHIINDSKIAACRIRGRVPIAELDNKETMEAICLGIFGITIVIVFV